MNIGTLIKSILMAAILWSMAVSAMAVTCKYEGVEPPDGTMPLQISAITVGRDLPLGTEVFRQTFMLNTSQLTTVVCEFAPFQRWFEYTVSAMYPKANWSTGPYANKVYKTDISGIGVAFKSQLDGVLPMTSTMRPVTCDAGHRCVQDVTREKSSFELVLIKIGEVSPGVLRGNRLPQITLQGFFGDARMLLYKVNHSGNIQIVANTCKTPDVVVPMGTHLSKTFTKVGSATGWKDFNIALNNCPAFHGTYAESASTWISQGGKNPGGDGYPGYRTDNNLQLHIDPARPAINARNGVLSLDPSGSSTAPAATGIGVQIADGYGIPLPLATVRDTDFYLQSEQGNYTIPLRARYLQTSSKVTPGPANASATFTLIYQ
ncbi:fimbrial protein [Pseudomonas putida]|uniref:fimbrial protein n=1 Tax=Pseudomonas putida TaxID=303 RepID=UPI0023665FD4|nr:fimbrial protein [Pseudomonas putida]MDD2047798.1 type 1 fimbrial protein [Pseudomonas putida]